MNYNDADFQQKVSAAWILQHVFNDSAVLIMSYGEKAGHLQGNGKLALKIKVDQKLW